MNTRICFLSSPSGNANSNHELLPRAFQKAGWLVSLVPQEQVNLTPAGIQLGALKPQDLDLIWLLGFGERQSCIDRFQILSHLDDSLFVTPPLTMLHLHAKPTLCQGPLQHLFLPGWVSGDTTWLKNRILSGGEWVIKPTASSYGQQVFKVSGDSQNLNMILESVTRHGYALLQKYLEAAEQGEKRVLIANGKIIGFYLRTSTEHFRSNLSAGAESTTCSLTVGDTKMVNEVMHYLSQSKVRFAAIDIVANHVMEINVANPGGLQTLHDLTHEDAALATALSFSYKQP